MRTNFVPNSSFCYFILWLFVILGVSQTQISAQSCSNFIVPAGNTFANGTFNGAGRISQNVRITGNVIFNGNVTFIGCNILIDPNANVTINPDPNTGISMFTLIPDAQGNPSRIFACNTMWNAINISANVGVEINAATFEGGRKGLVFQNGYLATASSIKNAGFLNNSVAITAENVSNLTFVSFNGNVFNGKLFTPALLPPHQNNEPFFGIKLNNTIANIGTAGSPNIFSRFSTAIRAENSQLRISNTQFSGNIFTDWEGFGTGIGIWTTNSSLTIQNQFTNGVSCSFLGNRRSIRSDRTLQLTIEDAEFRNAQVVDIEVIGSVNPANINILNNDFVLRNPTQHSVYIERPAQIGGVHMRIESNSWLLPDPNALATGINLGQDIRFLDIRAPQGLPLDNANISNNIFQNFHGNGTAAGQARTVDAIWIEDAADGYQINGNRIDYTNPQGPINRNITSVGIGLQGVTGVRNLIGSDNSIEGTLFFQGPGQLHGNLRESWLRCGIHLDASPNVRVCRNDVANTRHNYHYLGNCTNGELGRNNTQSGRWGLLLEGAQFQAQHHHRKNTWALGAFFEDNAAEWQAGNSQGAQWRFNGLNPPENPLAFSPQQWFLPNNTFAPIHICDTLTFRPNGLGEHTPDVGDVVSRFISDEYVFANPVDEWDFERNLLLQMLRFPSGFAGNAQAQNYYTAKIDSDLWKYAKAEFDLLTLAQPTLTQQQQLDLLLKNISVLSDSLGKIEQSESADTTTSDHSLQQQKALLAVQLDQQNSQLLTLTNSIRQDKFVALDIVKTNIVNLPENSNWESNLKHILKMRVNYPLEITGTAADSTLLRLIAYSCLDDGGEAVRRARSMLPVTESYAIPRERETDVYCSKDRKASDNNALNIAKIKLVPNPASDWVLIELNTSSLNRIDLLDLHGILVFSREVSDERTGSIILPTSHLLSGAYLVKAWYSNGNAAVEKLIIAH